MQKKPENPNYEKFVNDFIIYLSIASEIPYEILTGKKLTGMKLFDVSCFQIEDQVKKIKGGLF